MMNSLLSHIKQFIPLNDLLNFVFKTALSSYIITDDVDIPSIEKEISSKAFFSLKNIRLNTANINSFLVSSPIQLLNGTIRNVEISFVDAKLNIAISDITVLLMPLFSKERSSERKEEEHAAIKNDKAESQSMMQSVMNFLMMKFNLTIDNIAIKILTFEPNEMVINNNEFALYIGKIEVGKQSESDNSENLFLNGMKLRVWNICAKVNDKIDKNEEKLFFNINKSNNDDKSMFNFFCKSNTIFAMDYIKGPSIDISFTATSSLCATVNVAKSEIVLSPKQLHFVSIFSTVCGAILTSEEEKKELAEKANEINILGYKFKEFVLTVNDKGVDVVILENNCSEEMPKLFTFYSMKEYKKTLDKGIQSHFCYYEDNFFFVSVSPVRAEMKTHYDKETMTSMAIDLSAVIVSYVCYLSKEATVSDSKKSIVIRNSKIFTSISSRSSKLGGSIYESVNSFDESDSSVFASAIEEDDANAIDDCVRLIDYEFRWEQMKIVDVSGIAVSSYANDTNRVMNVTISDISCEIHFVILFAAMKMMRGNKFFDANVTQGMIRNKRKVNVLVRDDFDVDDATDKKSQMFIAINSLSMKLFNFKRDFKKIDGNDFFFNFYLGEVYPFFISKPNLPQRKKISISDIKSKEYLHLLLPDVAVLISSSQKESEIFFNCSDIQLNYNFYSLISFNNCNDSRKEFLTELAAPIKSSDVSYVSVDIAAMMSKNEMRFRNRIATMKTKKTKTSIELTVTKEILLNIEKIIYDELMLYLENFFIGYNIAQIYSAFIEKIYQKKLSLLLSYCGVAQNKIETKTSNEQSKIVITGEIATMTLFVNKNNSVDIDEGNLIKIPIDKTKMSYTMTSGNPINKIFVSIEDMHLFIRKNDKSYFKLLSKLPSSSESFLTMEISYQNVKKNANVIQIENSSDMKLNLTESLDDHNYEDFLLSHQLPMDDMKFNIEASIKHLMLFSLYSSIPSLKDAFKTIFDNLTFEEKIEKVDLIPLCENRSMEFLTKISLCKAYHDIFFNTDKDKVAWTRMILLIDHFALLNSKDTSIEVNGVNLFFTANMNVTDRTVNDVYDINDYLLTVCNENSYLRRIGFTEIFFLEKSSLRLTQKKINDKEISLYLLSISSIEANLCKDSFTELINFVELLLYHSTVLFSSLLTEPVAQKEKKVEKKQKAPSTFEIIDDYCEKRSLSVIKEESELSMSSVSNSSNGMFINAKKENNFVVVDYSAPKDGDCQYKISIDCVKVYLYKGKDFAFDDKENDLSMIQKSQIDSKKKSAFDCIIDDDYMSKSNENRSIKDKNYRKKIKQRDYKNYICIAINGLSVMYSTFNEEQSHCYLSFDVSKMEIEDHLEASKYRKMISKLNYEETIQHFITMSVDMRSKETERTIDANVTLVPLNILIDQKTLQFLLKFVTQPKKENLIETFEIIDKDNNEIHDENEKIDIVTSLKIEIKKFSINFSYNSNELLNITNITDLVIKFKQYKSKSPTELSQEINNIFFFYADDILKNQILSATLHSVAFIRPFTALAEGFIDIFKQPYIYYKRGNLGKGLRVGFKSCFAKLTIQSLFLGEKIAKVVTTLGKSNRDTSLNKTSYYKRWMYKLDENKRNYDRYFLKK